MHYLKLIQLCEIVENSVYNTNDANEDVVEINNVDDVSNSTISPSSSSSVNNLANKCLQCSSLVRTQIKTYVHKTQSYLHKQWLNQKKNISQCNLQCLQPSIKEDDSNLISIPLMDNDDDQEDEAKQEAEHKDDGPQQENESAKSENSTLNKDTHNANTKSCNADEKKIFLEIQESTQEATQESITANNDQEKNMSSISQIDQPTQATTSSTCSSSKQTTFEFENRGIQNILGDSSVSPHYIGTNNCLVVLIENKEVEEIVWV